LIQPRCCRRPNNAIGWQQESFMPIGRYFFVVGSVLLALLFLADWYYSAATATPPDTLSPSGGGIDRSILRIRSDQRWPERIVIDTSQPTIVPPAAVAELPRRAGLPRESFAAMDSGAAAPAPAAMRARPDRLKRQRIARHRQANSFASLQPVNGREPWPTGW
jgi:hypothetical protein